MASPFRTEETTRKYETYLKNNERESVSCALCEKPHLEKFKYWKIIENTFPYDAISKESHMFLPNRHVKENDLSEEELKEFVEIKDSFIHKKYDYIIECTHKEKSIPNHFHLHLLIKKDEYR